MSQENHRAMYNKLLAVTQRLKHAISQGNSEQLDELAREHQAVMAKLRQLGPSDDIDQLSLVKQLKDEVDDLVLLIAGAQDQLSEALASVGRRKKQASAYRNVGAFTKPTG